MDNMEELRQDVKEIKTEVKTISDTLLRNTISLEVHEKRTALLENRAGRLEDSQKWFIGLIISAVLALAIKVIFH